MTSLEETLPVLNEAVPALPGKVEAVARQSEAFEKEAREALAWFQERRAQAKALLDQVREAVAGVQEQADQAQDAVEHVGQALPAAAEPPRQGAESGAQDLQAAGQAVATAYGALSGHLSGGGDRTRAAHGEARQALESADGRAESSGSELDRLVDDVAAELEAARQAMAEEEDRVEEGVAALGDAMGRLLEDSRSRLGRTRAKLEELRTEQEAAVRTALAELTSGRAQIERELAGRLEGEVRPSVERELEAVAAALAGLGREVAQLQADCQGHRERAEPQLQAVADLLAPLRSGVEQVRQAADQVGLAWP